MPATWRLGSGPQGTISAMCSGVTVSVAAAKLTGLGSSAITFHPGWPKRNWSWAWAAPWASSGCQLSGICPQVASGRPPASR